MMTDTCRISDFWSDKKQNTMSCGVAMDKQLSLAYVFSLF